jgi:transcription-repair coupling factor (superfamily II helicase)
VDIQLNIAEFLLPIAQSSAAEQIASSISTGRVMTIGSAAGSSALALAASVGMQTRRPMLIVTAHLDEADDAVDQLELFAPGAQAKLFPALEVLPGESNVSPELSAQRLGVLAELKSNRRADFYVAPVQALMQSVPTRESLEDQLRILRPGSTLDFQHFIGWLADRGYFRLESVENPGDYAVRGEIIDVWPAAAAEPIRIDLLDDTIENIHGFDPVSLGPTGAKTEVQIPAISNPVPVQDTATGSVFAWMPDDVVVWLMDMPEVQDQARSYYERISESRGIYPPDAVMKLAQKRPLICAYPRPIEDRDAVLLPCSPLPPIAPDQNEALKELAQHAADSDVVVVCQSPSEKTRLADLLLVRHPDLTTPVQMPIGELNVGFVWRRGGGRDLMILAHHELFHRHHQRRRLHMIQGTRPIDHFLDLQPGDYVVHANHGIAQFQGITTLTRDGRQAEYLTLVFARESTLHVPVVQINLVQKYVGGSQGRPPLSTLGGSTWARQKEKTAEAVEKMAVEMLETQAAREKCPGFAFPADTVWMKEFENAFAFQPTEDQVRCIGEIKGDLEKPRPMDRLLCGDVGYGKTELAIRAAFKVCESGKQVAVLAPTTVLVEQHEETFKSRMAGYPFIVESISRFKSAAEIRQVIERCRKGQVDVLIGTHRLLSRDVQFAELGLVIIDEEQRFGVEHKERLKALRTTVDVLTMSATPIPRTLHMSLLGIRDISNLATPPRDRRSVVTEVIGWDNERIKHIIDRELLRSGQVYFVHNRVMDIRNIAASIQALVPQARIVVGHGQMGDSELESVMHEFTSRQADILVSTTIIESGLDIPTANTMIINNAHTFGLSDLHQLRGRVGRSKQRAYCYLLLNEGATLTDTAAKRLKAMEEYASLGAGFKIALRDLEIRGAGNLLGKEQSGHIAAVGYEMYCELLEEAVRKLRDQPVDRPREMNLDIGITGTLPRSYISADKQRMDIYRRLSRCHNREMLSALQTDVQDAFGPLPPAARTLFELTELRIAAAEKSIISLISKAPDVVFHFGDLREAGPLLAKAPGTVRPIDEKNVNLRLPPAYFQGDTLLLVLRRLFGLEGDAGNAGVATGPGAGDRTQAAATPPAGRKPQPTR